MEITGFVMDHAAAHRDGVSQYVVGDSDLLEGMNPARRERKIDRAPADNIAFARVGPSFIKIDIVATAPQVGRQQSAGQTAADQNKLRHD